MTKAELLAQIKDGVLRIPNIRNEQGSWTTEELNRAIVEAYNQGIDDSVELLDDNPEYDVQAVYKLKI